MGSKDAFLYLLYLRDLCSFTEDDFRKLSASGFSQRTEEIPAGSHEKFSAAVREMLRRLSQQILEKEGLCSFDLNERSISIFSKYENGSEHTAEGWVFRLFLCLALLLSASACKGPDPTTDPEFENHPESSEAVPTMSFAEARKLYGDDAIYVLLSIEGNSSLEDYVVTGFSECDGKTVVICGDNSPHDCIP